MSAPILVGYDRSDSSKRALERAIERCNEKHAPLLVLAIHEAVLDPTGCGDALRAALLWGLSQGWPLARCAMLGNRMGACKIASRGPQNYTFSQADRLI